MADVPKPINKNPRDIFSLGNKTTKRFISAPKMSDEMAKIQNIFYICNQ